MARIFLYIYIFQAYEKRVREIEHGSFTPLVLSASGGFAKEATNFYKRLASKLAEKWDHSYSLTMNWLRCTLSFALLRSAIQCIRGARSTRGRAVKASFSPVDLVISRGQLSTLLDTVFHVLISFSFSFSATLYSNHIFLFSFLPNIRPC